MNFTFHQALFGYDGGHQLLVTSLHLPTEARHSLAVATDISGSAPTYGFDQVYTGVPLVGTEFYALFCTWLAPEMPRPGCVWSQVLLIELPDLAELRDLGALRSLFVRPAAPTELDTFSRPLHYQTAPERPLRLPPSSEPLAAVLIEALYTEANRPVVLAATDALAYEELMFSLWSQQWPRLRRNFLFSTGSFADRGRSGPAFDLQITPEANLGAWTRSGKHLIIDAQTKSQEVEPWVREVLNDLSTPNSRGLRSFMSEYGVDLISPRGSFVRLVRTFQQTRSIAPTSWTQTLQSIAQDFPDTSDAVRLKEWVLSPQTSVGEQTDLELGWVTISFLLNDPAAKAYDSVSYNHLFLVTRLWHEKRKDLLELFAYLVRKDATPAASSFASAITNVVNPEDLREIWEIRQELLSPIISHRPNIAFSADVWRLPISAQWRVVEALTRAKLGQKDWGEVLAAMLVAKTDTAIDESVVRAGPFAIEAAFRWAESGGMRDRLPSSTWREALGPSAADRLEMIPLSPSHLALCAWLAPSDVVRQIAAVRPDVQELAREAIEDLPKPLLLPTTFFLITLGLRSEGKEGLPLIARGFAPVHAALAADDYPWESWQLLSPLLPHLGWFRDWDKCEKLRRAVRDWLANQDISRKTFYKTAETLGSQ
jgi:hypothetical protein